MISLQQVSGGKGKEHMDVVLISSDSEGEKEVGKSKEDFDEDDDGEDNEDDDNSGTDEDHEDDGDEENSDVDEDEEEDDDYMGSSEAESDDASIKSDKTRDCQARKKSVTGSSRIRAVEPTVRKKKLHKESVKRKGGHAILSEEEFFAEASDMIGRGDFGSLKMEHCKAYLRCHLLRLTGSKEVLLKRIQEHRELKNVGALVRYPRSSFTVNCTGDACVGDIVLFTQNVNKTYNKTQNKVRQCGKRVVAGRIVKESYGSDKQQHTFTVEVLWSKGPNALPLMCPLKIKGRNLYRMRTFRQRWPNENERMKVLEEKHVRGTIARATRMERILGKEHGRSKSRRAAGVSSNGIYRSEADMSQVTSCAVEGMSSSRRNMTTSLQRDTTGNPVPTKSFLCILKGFAGIMIGRQGRNVAAICNASGARVHICEDQLNPHMRLVEISGTPTQIQAATAMVVGFFVDKGLPLPMPSTHHPMDPRLPPMDRGLPSSAQAFLDRRLPPYSPPAAMVVGAFVDKGLPLPMPSTHHMDPRLRPMDRGLPSSAQAFLDQRLPP